MRVDLLTLYAFSDKVHAKQRELWRGFLALVLPLLLEYDASEFERLLESAQCRSIEELRASLDTPQNPSQLIWFISGSFAEVLGFEPELGLAAFLDVELPTRMHAAGRRSSAAKDETMISHWLKAFRVMQQRPEFLEMTSEWKQAFDLILETEEDEAGRVTEAERSNIDENSQDQTVDAGEIEHRVITKTSKKSKKSA